MWEPRSRAWTRFFVFPVSQSVSPLPLHYLLFQLSLASFSGVFLKNELELKNLEFQIKERNFIFLCWSFCAVKSLLKSPPPCPPLPAPPHHFPRPLLYGFWFRRRYQHQFRRQISIRICLLPFKFLPLVRLLLFQLALPISPVSCNSALALIEEYF